MFRQILKFRLVMALLLILALPCSNAFAWLGHGRERYHYRGGRWYDSSSWFWFGAGVTALTIGAIVENLPPRRTTVVVGGVPYYYYDDVYYRPYSYGGYVVVPEPVVTSNVVVTPAGTTVVATSAANQQGAFTVNIPNSQGGYSAVTLKKVKDGFIGPQGEFYPEFPSVEQLRLMYVNKKSK